MSVPVFVTDHAALSAADEIRLDGEEGRHAAVVRRIGVGERIDLTDGRGRVARCVVSAADRSGLTCAVDSMVDVPPPSPRIVVVQALAKGDRGETAVETMTEVGVDEIIPWAAARCIVQWKGERADKGLRRWRATVREAAKQARRAWVPEVPELATTPAVAARLRSADLGIVLHEDGDHPLSGIDLPDGGEIVVAVGPEGGMTPDELDGLRTAGGVIARLGPTVLRTSTAGTVAAGILLSRTQRWA
ncbi:16S rRNA (uracil(1498)-N(3))-methyltransferase [Actinobacteria bacterium YIM 96077]|uniref:Ribosomal RNA small subunit methyltransferase E n=1 Tax=Phytoactinopolyspora halophila TaxID=1981511 RepID=A0A329QFB0_9ACTN|nr:16S rRNA (uracil(1498)-N(3))-methyltransferase [Phytoactinopolyspora halophila]AYY14083.1 16S rRNA (uracil(1498)-N(3))-methyltransferase [Actinobacteria bacterium YIM 96077]RAW10990.1 16S rRNA (uracil(1498)-N(3))-methyltransferase [Phytoactinopolyspora halophila]